MTMSRSAVTWALASGRWTLSTTEVPSRRAPLWTCATEAAASGSSSTPAKTSGRGRPSSDSTALATTGHGDAGTSDCSWASSRANAGPMRSGRVASIWPSLTNVTPPSARASRTDRATPESVSPAGTPPLPRRYPPRPCFVAMVTIRAYRRLRRHRAGRPRSQGIGRGREPVGTIASRMTRTANPKCDGPGQAQEDEEQGLDGVDLGGQVTAAGLDVQLDARDPADELDDAAERPRHEQADDDGARPPHRHAEQPA